MTKFNTELDLERLESYRKREKEITESNGEKLLELVEKGDIKETTGYLKTMIKGIGSLEEHQMMMLHHEVMTELVGDLELVDFVTKYMTEANLKYYKLLDKMVINAEQFVSSSYLNTYMMEVLSIGGNELFNMNVGLWNELTPLRERGQQVLLILLKDNDGDMTDIIKQAMEGDLQETLKFVKKSKEKWQVVFDSINNEFEKTDKYEDVCVDIVTEGKPLDINTFRKMVKFNLRYIDPDKTTELFRKVEQVMLDEEIHAKKSKAFSDVLTDKKNSFDLTFFSTSDFIDIVIYEILRDREYYLSDKRVNSVFSLVQLENLLTAQFLSEEANKDRGRYIDRELLRRKCVAILVEDELYSNEFLDLYENGVASTEGFM